MERRTNFDLNFILFKELKGPPGRKEKNKVKVKNMGSEDIPEITTFEIENALKHLHNNKASGRDGFMVDKIMRQTYNNPYSKIV